MTEIELARLRTRLTAGLPLFDADAAELDQPDLPGLHAAIERDSQPDIICGVQRGRMSYSPNAATKGVSRWRQKFRVFVWIPKRIAVAEKPRRGRKPRVRGYHRFAGLYVGFHEARRVYLQRRKEWVGD